MFVISLVIMAVLVAADQLVKLAVTNNLPLNGQPVEVIKFGSFKVFSLTHIRNSGAAWSMMSGKTWFLIGLPVVVLIVAVIYMYKIRKGSKLELVSLAMVLAGVIGGILFVICFCFLDEKKKPVRDDIKVKDENDKA